MERFMKIAVACDHGGLHLKNAIKDYLTKNGYEYVDFGTNATDSCDYPDFVLPAAEAVAKGECDRGIFICSTGIGVSIVANKVPGVRCAHCHDTYCAEFTRLHNDANAIAMGEKVVGEGYALKIVEKFLTTDFEGGRHQRRVDKITAIEKKYCK
jgi:ribose 5-phosphate isomerase B